MFVIALSGPIASGKSQVAGDLQQRSKVVTLKTSDLIKANGAADERLAMVAGGDHLDEVTDGKWVLNGLLAAMGGASSAEVVIIDAVRKKRQIEHLRAHFGSAFAHLHIYAPDCELKRRFEERGRTADAGKTYEAAIDTETERGVRALLDVADLAIDSARMDGPAAAALVAAEFGLESVKADQLVDVVVGGQYGSEGKGNICAYIAEPYDVLMRVGGPNAGHKVPDPKFTFIHLPSGSLTNKTAQVLIGAGATIDVATILKEIDDLKKLGFDDTRLKIDNQAMIIEPSDKGYEERSMDKIGSTKKGVGAATARKILGRDEEPHLYRAEGAEFASPVRLARDIDELKPYLEETKSILEAAYRQKRRILLEGTQGTTLSIHHGPYPKVTSRETTVSGCLADAGIAPARVRKVIMVTRTYPIRVGGDSGWIMKPISAEMIAQRSGKNVEDIEKTEIGSISGKPRRIGEFDWAQLRTSAVLNAPTDIALTFADYLSSGNESAKTVEDLTADTQRFIQQVENVAGAPVTLISVRFAADGVIDRRTW